MYTNIYVKLFKSLQDSEANEINVFLLCTNKDSFWNLVLVNNSKQKNAKDRVREKERDCV